MPLGGDLAIADLVIVNTANGTPAADEERARAFASLGEYMERDGPIITLHVLAEQLIS